MACLICTVLLLTPFIFYGPQCHIIDIVGYLWGSFHHAAAWVPTIGCWLTHLITKPTPWPVIQPLWYVVGDLQEKCSTVSTVAMAHSPQMQRHKPALLCLEQMLPERCQHSWQTLTDGHPYVNWHLGCIGKVFLSTLTTGYVDPWVFAYPYPHPHKPLPVRYGYGFGQVRVWVWVFYLRVTQVIHYRYCHRT